MKEDIVNPKRYTQNKLECWDFWIKAGLDPLIASAVKYVWRYKYKNGIEDLKKAKVFLEKAIEEVQKGTIYHSEKYYLIVPGEVKDFSNKQFIFMRIASQTTGKTNYTLYCEDMISIVDDMIDELEETSK
jgi:hypothetical protein